MAVIYEPTVTLAHLDGSHISVWCDNGSVYAQHIHTDGTHGCKKDLDFPHIVTAVFLCNKSNYGDRVYAVVDTSFHLAEIHIVLGELDVPVGKWLVVMDQSDGDIFMPRSSTDMHIMCMDTTESGRYIAIGHCDGAVRLYRLTTLDGNPSFAPMACWHFKHGSIVTQIDCIDNEQKEDGVPYKIAVVVGNRVFSSHDATNVKCHQIMV